MILNEVGFILDFPLSKKRCVCVCVSTPPRVWLLHSKSPSLFPPLANLKTRQGPTDVELVCRLLYLRSGGSTFQASQWPQQWAELSWVGFSTSYSRSRFQGSRFNGVCDGANERLAGSRWTVQDLCSCLRASNDSDQINEECGIYRMPNSVGKRFKPTKYIPVSTAATLLVGSTTLFFVFT